MTEPETTAKLLCANVHVARKKKRKANLPKVPPARHQSQTALAQEVVLLTRVSRLAQKDGEITKEDANQHNTAKQLATRSDEVKRPELLIEFGSRTLYRFPGT